MFEDYWDIVYIYVHSRWLNVVAEIVSVDCEELIVVDDTTNHLIVYTTYNCLSCYCILWHHTKWYDLVDCILADCPKTSLYCFDSIEK